MTATLQSDRIENFFAGDVQSFTDGLARLESAIPADAAAAVDNHFHSLLQLLDQVREACRNLEALIDDEEMLKAVRRRYQDAIAPWLNQSWMMHHAGAKPRGYPGDHEMLTVLYNGQVLSKGLGGYFDLFFMQTELGRAVPARLKALREFLIQELRAHGDGMAVLNVACGPSREFMGGLPEAGAIDASITLVDFDEDALKYSQGVVAAYQNDLPNFEFVRYNALRLQAPRRFAEQYGKFDLIYSIGLCDYLSDRQLVGMFRGCRELLKPGGTLYIAFKDMHRYDKTDYQWLVEWFFLERNEEDCQRLFVEAGWPAESMSMTRDETGIIMNFVGRTSATPILRTDRGHDAVRGPLAIPTESVGGLDGELMPN